MQCNLLIISTYPEGDTKSVLTSELVYAHEVHTGTERGVLTIQECLLNQVLTNRVGLCT